MLIWRRQCLLALAVDPVSFPVYQAALAIKSLPKEVDGRVFQSVTSGVKLGIFFGLTPITTLFKGKPVSETFRSNAHIGKSVAMFDSSFA